MSRNREVCAQSGKGPEQKERQMRDLEAVVNAGRARLTRTLAGPSTDAGYTEWWVRRRIDWHMTDASDGGTDYAPIGDSVFAGYAVLFDSVEAF